MKTKYNSNYKYIDVAVGVNGYVRKTFDEIEKESESNGILNIYRINDSLDEDKLKVAGVEPLLINEMSEDDVLKIVKSEKIVGVGETGLDFFSPFVFRKKQINTFEKHLKEAQERNLPVIAKCVNAFDDFYYLMEKYPEVAQRTIVTRFDGSIGQLVKLISIGCYIGVDDYIVEQFGNSATMLQIMLIPKERLIPYTGSPYSRVTDLDGKRRENYPWYLKQVVRRLSEIFLVDEDEMGEVCLENTKNLFSLEF